jgi:hypothetical protein
MLSRRMKMWVFGMGKTGGSGRRGRESNMSPMSRRRGCPVCCTEVRKWLQDLLYRKWSVINETPECWKTNCISKMYLMDIRRYLRTELDDSTGITSGSNLCLHTDYPKSSSSLWTGQAVAKLVDALCYKPKGHGSDSRWSHCIFSNWPNSSSRSMAPEPTQPVIEMSTRNLPGGKGRPSRKADNLTAICEPNV